MKKIEEKMKNLLNLIWLNKELLAINDFAKYIISMAKEVKHKQDILSFYVSLESILLSFEGKEIQTNNGKKIFSSSDKCTEEEIKLFQKYIKEN